MRRQLLFLFMATLCCSSLISCAAYRPQNLSGKRFDANSSLCRGLRTEATRLYRVANYTDEPIAHYANNPIGFVAVSDRERSLARNRAAMECELQSAYRQRNKLNLFNEKSEKTAAR